jgi:hypothetical protein
MREAIPRHDETDVLRWVSYVQLDGHEIKRNVSVSEAWYSTDTSSSVDLCKALAQRGFESATNASCLMEGNVGLIK